jgi:hypothetical protein
MPRRAGLLVTEAKAGGGEVTGHQQGFIAERAPRKAVEGSRRAFSTPKHLQRQGGSCGLL